MPAVATCLQGFVCHCQVMDAQTFIRWALDDNRTLEERYTTELMVERGVGMWNARRQIYESAGISQMMERKRQRALNPAYEPEYSEEQLRQTAECIPDLKFISFSGYGERPIRDI